MTTARIIVAGRPAPQGSKTRGGAGQLREQSAYLPAWRQAVKVAVLRTLANAGIEPADRPIFPHGTPVHVRVDFTLHPDQPDPTAPPDIDKLLRATFDAITAARLWADDSQAVSVTATERAAVDPFPLGGAYIEITDEIVKTPYSRESAPMSRYRLSLVDLDAPENDPGDGALIEVVGPPALLAMMLPAIEQALTGDTAAPTRAIAPQATAATENGHGRRKRRTKAEMEAARAAESPVDREPTAVHPATEPPEPPVPPAGGFNPFAPKP